MQIIIYVVIYINHSHDKATDLLPRVYAVAAQHGRGAGRDPHAGQRVRVHLVLLDQPLALLVHVDAAVLAVVDLVVPDYWVAVCAYLCSI